MPVKRIIDRNGAEIRKNNFDVGLSFEADDLSKDYDTVILENKPKYRDISLKNLREVKLPRNLGLMRRTLKFFRTWAIIDFETLKYTLK